MKWSISNQKIICLLVKKRLFVKQAGVMSATNEEWLGCAAGYARAELLTLSIWRVINTSYVWMAYFIPKREVRFAPRRCFLC